MFDIGRICVKTAGRDGNKKCVVVDVIDEKYVLIDGETRRKKCNITHLEPLNEKIDIKKNTPHEEIVMHFERMGIKIPAKRIKKLEVKAAEEKEVKKKKK